MPYSGIKDKTDLLCNKMQKMQLNGKTIIQKSNLPV